MPSALQSKPPYRFFQFRQNLQNKQPPCQPSLPLALYPERNPRHRERDPCHHERNLCHPSRSEGSRFPRRSTPPPTLPQGRLRLWVAQRFSAAIELRKLAAASVAEVPTRRQVLETRHASSQPLRPPSSWEPSEPPLPASAPDTADRETPGPTPVSSSLQLATPPQT